MIGTQRWFSKYEKLQSNMSYFCSVQLCCDMWKEIYCYKNQTRMQRRSGVEVAQEEYKNNDILFLLHCIHKNALTTMLCTTRKMLFHLCIGYTH